MKVTIIFLGITRIQDAYFSPARGLAEALSENFKVYYINNPYTLKDKVLSFNRSKMHSHRVWKNKKGVLFRSSPNFFVYQPADVYPINFLPPSKLYNKALGYNQLLFQKSVNYLFKREHISDYIIINSFNPYYIHKLFKLPLFRIYQCIDKMDQCRYLQKHGPILENQIMNESDLVIFTAKALLEHFKRISTPKALIPNAVSSYFFEAFSSDKNTFLQEIQKYPGRKIGFCGHLDEERVDVELICKVADTYQEDAIIIIGPVSIPEEKIRKLKAHKNIHFLGPIEHQLLPQVYGVLDCSIIPYKTNALTQYIYPLKIHECLATGTPVISTSFSQDIQEFESLISVTASEEEFTKAIDAQLKNPKNTKQALINFTHKHRWVDRADYLTRVINKTTGYDIITLK